MGVVLGSGGFEVHRYHAAGFKAGNHQVGAHLHGEAGSLVGSAVRMLGLAPVKQVLAEALAAHGGGQVLNLLPWHALGGALVLVELQYRRTEMGAE